MIRLMLPIAAIAALLLAPIFLDEVKGSDLGGGAVTLTGNNYVADTLNCFLKGDFSIGGDCKPEGGTKGFAIFAALFAAAVAAVFGVLGLIPMFGRAASAVTTLAGAIVLAGIGYYMLVQLGTDEGVESLQWGAYLIGGLGLLTVITGLSGVRGR